MSFRHGGKTLELIPFEASGRRGIDLPRDRLIKQISLNFDADLVVTDPGAGVAGTVAQDSVLHLMPRIEVIGNGSIVLFRGDSRGLYFKNMFEYGTINTIVVPGAGTAATYPVDFEINIDFENNVGLVPGDSFLNAPAYTTLKLNILWAACAVCFDSDHTMVDTIAANFGVTPVIYESTEPVARLVRIQDVIEKEITATTANFPVDLPLGDRIYQDAMFMTTDVDTGVAVRESDIVNYINLKTDDTFRHFDRIPWIHLERINKRDCSLEVQKDGLAYLKLLEQGRITSGLQVIDTNSARLNFDVTVGTGETVLKVYTDAILPA